MNVYDDQQVQMVESRGTTEAYLITYTPPLPFDALSFALKISGTV